MGGCASGSVIFVTEDVNACDSGVNYDPFSHNRTLVNSAFGVKQNTSKLFTFRSTNRTVAIIRRIAAVGTALPVIHIGNQVFANRLY